MLNVQWSPRHGCEWVKKKHTLQTCIPCTFEILKHPSWTYLLHIYTKCDQSLLRFMIKKGLNVKLNEVWWYK